MSKEQPAPAGPLVLNVACVADGKYYAAYQPLPFDAATLPDTLRPYLADEEPDEPQGSPTLNFQPGRVYDVDDRGAILTRHGRRQAAQLAGEAYAQQQAEEEAIAAGALDPETEAILQAEHDLRIGAALAGAESAARNREAVMAAAQQKNDAGEKPADPLYVRRGGAWMHAERAKLRPGETVFAKEPSGEWASVGTVNSTGGLPPQEVIS